jgi:hypothetical protein
MEMAPSTLKNELQNPSPAQKVYHVDIEAQARTSSHTPCGSHLPLKDLGNIEGK